jgi:chaperonin GroES
MKINLRPLADRVVVEPLEAPNKTKGGLFLPDQAKDKPLIGHVLAVGPGRYTEKGDLVPMELKPGDRVHYTVFAGIHIELDGREYLLVKESDVIAVELKENGK